MLSRRPHFRPLADNGVAAWRRRGGTLSVIRTTNGQIPHKRSLEVTPPLAPNRLLPAGIFPSVGEIKVIA